VLALACRVYLIISLYVRLDKVLLKVVRNFESLGGRVVFVDEELRRLIVNVKASLIDAVEHIILESASGYSANVKVACLVNSLSVIEDMVRGLRGVRAGANTYYVSVNGRVVEVSFRGGGRVDVKVGVRSSLVTPVPPAVFNIDLRGVREVLAELPGILGALGLEGGGLG
jgi:hypothetical protein